MMVKRWAKRVAVGSLLGCVGCSSSLPIREYDEVAHNVETANLRPPHTVTPDDPMAVALDPAPVPPGISGEQPLDVYIQQALSENRAVQAARFNLLAMKARIPQETALDDPMVQNTIWPFPMNAPQYSLMGYGPYEMMITQQFPWFGTLKLRGQAAEQEVKTAFYELMAAQLEVVERVKRGYYNLYFNQRAEAILAENKKLAEDFVVLAQERFKAGGTTLQDVLRAQNAVTDVDSELITVRQDLAGSRAQIARLLHVSPEADLRTMASLPVAAVPQQVEMLYRMAAAARPELQGRLAEIARDERQVELAKKKYLPNITAGLSYMLMTRENNGSPRADGRDNFGLLVSFNLPVYRQKLDAAVTEAKARAIADSRRYDDLRDETYEQVKELYLEASARRETLELFRVSYLPRAEEVLKLAANDYQAGNQDFLTLITSLRELLTVQLQIARLESDLGKAVASLERVVGVQLNEHPPAEAIAMPPPAAEEPGPFAP